MDDRVEALVASLHMEHCESGDGMHKVIRAAVIAGLELAADIARDEIHIFTDGGQAHHALGAADVMDEIRALARGGGGDK